MVATPGNRGWNDAWSKSLHAEAQGVYQSGIECAKLNVADMGYQLTQKQKKVKALKAELKTLRKAKAPDKKKISKAKKSLFWTSRRIIRLEKKLATRKAQLKENKIPLTLGGKKLFREQYHLTENGFKSHEDWRAEWEAHRNGNFSLIGKRHATLGNEQAKIHLSCEKNLVDRISLNLPEALRHLLGGVAGVDFNIKGLKGQKNLAHLQAALGLVPAFTKKGKAIQISQSPVSVRFFYNFERVAGLWL